LGFSSRKARSTLMPRVSQLCGKKKSMSDMAI
jgi:hypothetical protein